MMFKIIFSNFNKMVNSVKHTVNDFYFLSIILKLLEVQICYKLLI